MKENLAVDAILCDIHMPQMDGLEFLSVLRALGFNTPLIFLTAHGDRGHVIRALKNGAFDFFDKPFDLVKLMESVRLALSVGLKLREIELLAARDSNNKNLTTIEKAIGRQLLLMKGFNESKKRLA
jgi:FixJ family two-component response regulator